MKLNLLNATYLLYANDNFVGNGVIVNPVVLKVNSSTPVQTIFTMSYSKMLFITGTYLFDKGRIAWEVNGNATINEPVIGTVTLPFACGTQPKCGL